MSKSGRIAALTAAGVLSVGLLAACSSSGGSSGSKNNSPSPAAFNEATATQEITTNWETFFNNGAGAKTTAEKVALLQNGSELQPILVAQSKNPQAKGSSAKVKKVVIAPNHTSATVTYDLLVNGTPQLSGSTGTSVLDAGVWKVSKASFCGLIALGAQSTGATPPPQCAA